MYGYVWLCRAVYGCVWLCRAMLGYVGLCKAIERNVFYILANGEPLYDAYTTYLPWAPLPAAVWDMSLLSSSENNLFSGKNETGADRAREIQSNRYPV